MRFHTLLDCIKNEFKEETLEVNCEEGGCKSKKMVQTKTLVNSPSNLIFNINRTIVKKDADGNNVTVNDQPLQIKMNHLVELHPKLEHQGRLYRLNSFVCHSGQKVKSGHYVTVLCNGNQEILCNDSQVRVLKTDAEKKEYRKMATIVFYELENSKDTSHASKKKGGEADRKVQ